MEVVPFPCSASWQASGMVFHHIQMSEPASWVAESRLSTSSSQGRAIFGYLTTSVGGLLTVLTRIKLYSVVVGTHKRNKASATSNDTLFPLY